MSPDFELLVPDDLETADTGVFHYKRIDDNPEVNLIHKVYKRPVLIHEQIQGIISGVAENVPDQYQPFIDLHRDAHSLNDTYRSQQNADVETGCTYLALNMYIW